MVARFLHFFPQYRLADLREMPAGEFLYLLGGMLDLENPEATEPREEKIRRLTLEAHRKAAGSKRGRRR